jgi:hypothetical protein
MTSIIEEFRKIIKYPGYSVSNLGRIRSHLKNPKNPFYIKITKKHNILIVYLRKDKKEHIEHVYNLVAETFVDNPNQYQYVRFIDDNSMNIHATNLEWIEHIYPIYTDWEVIQKYPAYEMCKESVRNTLTKRPLTLTVNYQGYVSVSLQINGKSKHKLMHVLIAVQYIPNPNKLPEVNHKDGNKQNYSINNLEWVTKKENIQHAVDTGLAPSKKNKGTNIELLDINHNIIQIFPTVQATAIFIDSTSQSINYYLKKICMIIELL